MKKSKILLISVLLLTGFILGQTKRIRPEPEPMIVTCKALINPATGRVVRNAAIEIAGGKILRIGSAGSIKAGASVKIVDFGDKYIIPGLIDTHGHLFGGVTVRHTTADMVLPFYLACGVTSVRSPGSMEPEGDMGLRFRVDSGRLIGPRYFLSGPYIEADPVTVRWMNPVKTPEEVRLKIEAWIKQGATSVKIYARMNGELLKTAIDFGHAHGVKVIGHVGAVTWKDAIAMGLDELFHGVLALPDLSPDNKDQKDSESKYAKMDLRKSEFQDLLRSAARSKVVLTPTAVINDTLNEKSPDFAEQKKYYTPEAWAKLEERMKKPLIPGSDLALKKNMEFIKLAHSKGCILSTGTDRVDFGMLPGFSLWHEMEIFARAGLDPMDILKAATANGAFAIGRSDLLGSLEEGKLADFVVLDADPRKSISNVRKVFRVVKDGVVYVPGELLKPLEGKYY
jgi:hypothetical protein